jgi:UDP:flavonoid glycosyltransferase YjiC (YdhE family)
MRILFTTLRNTSHFLPLVPFIDACRRRGHEVAVAAPPDLAERVAVTGAEFFPFGHPGDEGLRPLWMRIRAMDDEDAKRFVIGELFAGACAGAALPGLRETMEGWRPAIVVREAAESAAIVACEKVGVPHVRVAITARTGESAFISVTNSFLDRYRAELGVPLDPSGEAMRGEPALTLFPPSLEAPTAAASPVRRFRAARREAAPLPDWWGDRREPLVYVTLGTVTGGMDPMRAAYRVALDAVSELPVRVLLTIGSELPVEELGEIPVNAHVERFVPQDDVLPHAAAVVCHGGSGTMLGTLAAGVPMVVTPLFADQPDNAERVAAIGAGLSLPTRAARADAVRGALRRVLGESSFRHVARQVAAEMAALPPIEEAAVDIERFAAEGSRS